MPRSAAAKRKAKNAGVGIDFKKARHKVGKKLPQARNETDTNFKSKAISLPGQNIGEEKGAAVSARNLTLKELLGQSGHYNAKIRAGALQGIAELLGSHPEEFKRHSGPVIEKLAERVADSDKQVRAALRDLLTNQMLPGLQNGQLLPFLPLLMAHVTSAMTHLQDDIRADALLFLDIMMSAAPAQVSEEYMIPALQHYSTLLSQPSRARSITSSSLSSLLEGLQSLHKFLAKAEASDAQQTSSNVADKAASSADSHHCELLFGSYDTWPVSLMIASARKQLLQTAGNSLESEPSPDRVVIKALLGHVEGAWRESVPSALGDASDLSAVQAMACCLHCFHLLLNLARKILAPGEILEAEKAVQKRVEAYFPFGSPAVKMSSSMQQALVSLNLAGLELFTSFLESNCIEDMSQHLPVWVTNLLDYYSAILLRGEVLPSHGNLTETLDRPSVPSHVYTAVLNGVGKVVSKIPWQKQREIIAGVTALLTSSNLKSSTKMACLGFVACVFAQPRKFLMPNAFGQPLVLQSEAAKWLEEVPKLLWSWGSSRPESTQLVLQILLHASQTAPANGEIEAVLKQMQASLAPFFCLLLTGEGKCGKARNIQNIGARVASPLPKLTSKVQMMAVDLLYSLPELGQALQTSAAQMCLLSQYPTAVASRLISDLANRFVREGKPESFVGFATQLLQGRAGGTAMERDLPARIEILKAVLGALSLCGSGKYSVIAALEPTLVAMLQPEQDFERQYNAFAVTLHLSAHSNTASSTQEDTAEMEDPAGEQSGRDRALGSVEVAGIPTEQSRIPGSIRHLLPQALCRLFVVQNGCPANLKTLLLANLDEATDFLAMDPSSLKPLLQELRNIRLSDDARSNHIFSQGIELISKMLERKQLLDALIDAKGELQSALESLRQNLDSCGSQAVASKAAGLKNLMDRLCSQGSK